MMPPNIPALPSVEEDCVQLRTSLPERSSKKRGSKPSRRPHAWVSN